MPDNEGGDGRALEQARRRIQHLEQQVKQLEGELRALDWADEGAARRPGADEEQLRLQLLYNELLLDNCPNMIFLFDEGLRFISCSLPCLPFLANSSRSALGGLPFKQVFAGEVDAAWVDAAYERNLEVLDTLAPCEHDDVIEYGVDGEMFVQLTVAPMVDDETSRRGTIMTVTDVTELTRARQRAEENARTKNSFFANVSHEIRTPMNAIKGLSELLALSKLDPVQRSYVDNIITSANTLIGVINDVLDYSKNDAGSVELNERPYNVGELLAEVTNVVSLQADDNELVLMVDADPDMPAVLWGDDLRLKQIITNLLSNAIRHTPEGYVRLTLAAENREGETELLCTVEDSGVGIKEEDLPGLFETFNRADLHTNVGISGTGLGLAISRQLALAMQGDITVRSVYGRGSVFSLAVAQRVIDTRPLARVDSPAAARVLLLGEGLRMEDIAQMLGRLGVACAQTADGGGEWPGYTHCIYDTPVPAAAVRLVREKLPGGQFATLRDMRSALAVPDTQDTLLFTPLLITELARHLNRSTEEPRPEAVRPASAPPEVFTVQNTLLLVVDDNEVNLMVSSEMLRAFGAGVMSVDSGEEALRLCAAQQFDIIFMDHMMPGMDGIEVTARLRSEKGPNQQTPVVALTAHVVDDTQSYYVRCGMDDYIAKPVEFVELGRVLCRWLPAEKVVPDGG